MSTNKTQNYQLNQWVKSDRVLMSEFNADNAKIDAALASKASASALSSLQSVVNGKASASSVTSLSQTVTQGLNLRNCRLVAGTYTGTGKYGQANPNTLTFPAKPFYVFVTCGTQAALHMPYGLAYLNVNDGGITGMINISWTDRSVSWYTTSTNSSHAATLQMNSTNTIYYIAFLEID